MCNRFTLLFNISVDALLHYYNFGITSNEQTLLDGIQKIPPGSTLLVRDGCASVTPYFSISQLYGPELYRTRLEKELCETIDTRLLKTVRKWLPESGPVGIALSGGVRRS